MENTSNSFAIAIDPINSGMITIYTRYKYMQDGSEKQTSILSETLDVTTISESSAQISIVGVAK
jgi:hypothetical protein